MTESLSIYNTLTRQKERFETIEPGVVRMYVCGVTPYASAHVGHAMSLVVFDVIRRYLEHRGYHVRHVQNFTDIDDKIIARAQQEGVTPAEIVEPLIAAWHEESRALNVLPATIYPRATTEIPFIISMIEGLIEKGFAYVVDGDVYYRVRAFSEYGKLSHRDIDELLAGARIEVDERKEDPLDFALWKAAKPGEPSWQSPWGPGRPGWHIECSAMCTHHLGGTVDIHGGGADLIFPHHENEIAQSEAYLGKKPFARYWIHNGLLQFGGDKMSKSLGNIVRIRDLIDRGLAPAFRLMVLQSHYRAPLTFSEEGLEAADRGLERLRSAARPEAVVAATPGSSRSDHQQLETVAALTDRRFHQAMDDDFDTPVAVAALFDLARAINRARTEGMPESVIEPARRTLVELGAVLGLQLEVQEPESAGDAAPFIDLLVQVRDALRSAKQWALADMIRDELAKRGITVADGPAGTTWRKA
ncbi:MAG: cysteine--tRNA ligase [Thermomicrobiales bacterium]|nr:MAG: cysteine--tRNA ligase [Thermomicrobiales bacterium]